MQALAIQCEMSDAGIAYNMSSYSSSDFAKALQSAGMHCMLVFPPGHCQVAVEIWETGEHLLIETACLPITTDNYKDAVVYLS